MNNHRGQNLPNDLPFHGSKISIAVVITEVSDHPFLLCEVEFIWT
jgi:hypothetical protein